MKARHRTPQPDEPAVDSQPRLNTDCDCFDFSYATSEAKTLHLVPVKFTAGNTAGGIKHMIRIKTDLNDTPTEIVAWAAVDNQAK